MTENNQAQSRVRSVMEDPSAQAIARVYAEAFLNAAGGEKAGDTLEEFASFVNDVLAKHPQFETLFTSNSINREEKVKMVGRVLGSQGTDIFRNFLCTLARHERLDLLPLILQESEIQFEKRCGKQRVSVFSPFPLSADAQARIQAELGKSLPFEPILETSVDPSLLGGLKIQVGDTVYDSTIKSRMKSLRKLLRKRSHHEIQCGRDRFSHPEGN